MSLIFTGVNCPIALAFGICYCSHFPFRVYTLHEQGRQRWGGQELSDLAEGYMESMWQNLELNADLLSARPVC